MLKNEVFKHVNKWSTVFAIALSFYGVFIYNIAVLYEKKTGKKFPMPRLH